MKNKSLACFLAAVTFASVCPCPVSYAANTGVTSERNKSFVQKHPGITTALIIGGVAVVGAVAGSVFYALNKNKSDAHEDNNAEDNKIEDDNTKGGGNGDCISIAESSKYNKKQVDSKPKSVVYYFNGINSKGCKYKCFVAPGNIKVFLPFPDKSTPGVSGSIIHHVCANQVEINESFDDLESGILAKHYTFEASDRVPPYILKSVSADEDIPSTEYYVTQVLHCEEGKNSESVVEKKKEEKKRTPFWWPNLWAWHSGDKSKEHPEDDSESTGEEGNKTDDAQVVSDEDDKEELEKWLKNVRENFKKIREGKALCISESGKSESEGTYSHTYKYTNDIFMRDVPDIPYDKLDLPKLQEFERKICDKDPEDLTWRGDARALFVIYLKSSEGLKRKRLHTTNEFKEKIKKLEKETNELDTKFKETLKRKCELLESIDDLLSFY